MGAAAKKNFFVVSYTSGWCSNVPFLFLFFALPWVSVASVPFQYQAHQLVGVASKMHRLSFTTFDFQICRAISCRRSNAVAVQRHHSRTVNSTLCKLFSSQKNPKSKRPPKAYRNRLTGISVNHPKGKTKSSTLWLARQAKDPFTLQAHQRDYASRAAFKLEQMNKQHRFLRPGQTVVDLGAAPGGWTQMAVELTEGTRKDSKSRIFSVDRLDMNPVKGSTFLKLDFSEPKSEEILLRAIQGDKEERSSYTTAIVDVVLSDMAPSFCGDHSADHARLM